MWVWSWKERFLVIVLSWCTEMGSEGDMGTGTGLTSVFSARVWVAEQWKVAGEQKDPLKSYCSVLKANHLPLGYPKTPGFCVSSSHSIPCAGKEPSKAPHLTLLHGWNTLYSLDRLLGKLDTT